MELLVIQYKTPSSDVLQLPLTYLAAGATGLVHPDAASGAEELFNARWLM